MSRTPPVLILSRSAWRRIHRDLARRGRGERESAVFLLGRAGDQRVRAWVAYDDIDPTCLTGGISFTGARFADLWNLCRDHGLAVIADLHTHPGRWVEQSPTDQAKPTIARAGHVSLITPSFAQQTPPAAQVGVHIYQGEGQWRSTPTADRPQALRITSVSWWRAAAVAPTRTGAHQTPLGAQR